MNPAEIMFHAVFLLAGLLLGAGYFHLLARTARAHLNASPLSHILPLYILRIGAAILTFWIAAQYGALPLLITAAGFLLARVAMLQLIEP